MALAHCESCNILLVKPYIRCSQCPDPHIELCLCCFSGGFEQNSHKSDHMYEVIKDDFCLFEHSWSAGEEIRLLDAVAECGFGNWLEVSERMQYKTADECENHYRQYYLVSPQSPLPVCQAPPRPAEDSTQQIEMSGYSAARSDFTVEHNNFAELDVRDITLTEVDGSLEAELQLAMLHIYRSILKERRRRKFIVRQFGLIDVATHQAFIRRYEQVLSTKTMETLRRLSSLFVKQPLLWDFVIEALSLDAALRQHITKLQKYRQAGLRWLRSAKVYEKMSATQPAGRPQLLNDVLHFIQESYQCQPWVQRKMVFDKLSRSINVSHPAPSRRSAPPLDIVGLPGSERLTPAEKQLCSQVRLIPESYLEFKNVLVNECNKHGHLRLAQARSLIKIDVNKTRKIYDFLVSQHVITTNKNSTSCGDTAKTS